MLCRPPVKEQVDLSGIFVEESCAMKIHMHILLPVKLWNYNEQTTQVCIIFGHPNMGQWKVPIPLYKAG